MDRFFRGFIAGIIGGIFMNIWSVLAYYVIKISEIRFLDWASVFLYGHMPLSIPEALYALIIQIGFAGGLGVLMAYFIQGVGSQGYLLKGIVFGFGIFFLIYSIPTLFNTPGLVIIPFFSALSNNIGGIIWGFTTAYCLGYFDNKLKSN